MPEPFPSLIRTMASVWCSRLRCRRRSWGWLTRPTRIDPLVRPFGPFTDNFLWNMEEMDAEGFRCRLNNNLGVFTVVGEFHSDNKGETPMAKKFMYVCVGLMALAGAYSFGAQGVVAQAGLNEVTAVHLSGGAESTTTVFTTDGSIYSRPGFPMHVSGKIIWAEDGRWTYMGNTFGEGEPVHPEGSAPR